MLTYWRARREEELGRREEGERAAKAEEDARRIAKRSIEEEEKREIRLAEEESELQGAKDRMRDKSLAGKLARELQEETAVLARLQEVAKKERAEHDMHMQGVRDRHARDQQQQELQAFYRRLLVSLPALSLRTRRRMRRHKPVNPNYFRETKRYLGEYNGYQS